MFDSSDKRTLTLKVAIMLPPNISSTYKAYLAMQQEAINYLKFCYYLEQVKWKQCKILVIAKAEVRSPTNFSGLATTLKSKIAMKLENFLTEFPDLNKEKNKAKNY